MTRSALDPPAPPSPVFAAFASKYRGPAEALATTNDELGELVLEVVRTGRDAWPAVEIDAEAFAEHIGRHLPPERPIVEALLAVRAADLALAHACARHNPVALAVFEETFDGELSHVLARVRFVRDDLDDAKQVCRQKLFTSSPPKIGEYAGQGDLRHWLRVTLLRTAIDLGRRKGTGEELREGGAFDALAASEPDPELGYLKKLYAAEFREAFETSAASLDPEERNLLRQHYAHGLTVDQIGALYGIHRATAARRVARARDNLFTGTRRLLMERLRLDRRELDSVMRFIESGVTVSVRRVLGATSADDG